MPLPTLTPSATPTPTSTPAPVVQADVQIRCISFDGLVPTSEADEYVEITNTGNGAQALAGWKLADISDGQPVFEFPSGTLAPGGVVRVYTDEVHPEWGSYSFGRGTAIWSNSSPDTAGLYDAGGTLVSMKSYPPGC